MGAGFLLLGVKCRGALGTAPPLPSTPSELGKVGNLLLQHLERQLGRTRARALTAGRGLVLIHRTMTFLGKEIMCLQVWFSHSPTPWHPQPCEKP